jgi:hypothetical protein
MARIEVKPDISPEAFLANLTEAVYKVVLDAGKHTPFNELTLNLQAALREVMGRDMLVSDDFKKNFLIRKIKPWSLAANAVFKKMEAKYALIGLRKKQKACH